MKTQTIFKSIILALVCGFLFSFMPGGDSYTIYLNKKQIAREYLARHGATPVISLDQVAESDLFEVYFSECGLIGKSRVLSVRDDQKILTEWKFANTTDEHSPMTFTGKDLMVFRKPGKQLKLIYTSETATEARHIANLTWGSNSVVKK